MKGSGLTKVGVIFFILLAVMGIAGAQNTLVNNAQKGEVV